MQINLNWLKDYVAWDSKVSAGELADLIGRRLGEIEASVDLADKYAGVEIARVASVEVFPGRDRIRRAVIETSRGSETVVCGAPNLSPGQLAVWLPVGETVPATWGSSQPMVLAAKEIAGVVSQGMLLSPAELDWGSDNEGIVILNDPARARFWLDRDQLAEPQPGQSLTEYLDLGLVVDVENKMLTNRPDCFGLLGLAREVAGIVGQPFRSPDWYRLEKAKNQLEAPKIKIDCPDQAARFRAVRLMGLTVKPSAVEVLARLSSVGIKPVNNLVDVTNYMMYLSGQPTHAFDWLALGQPSSFGVRRSRKGDELELINGQSLSLGQQQPATLVVADDQPVALGGVIGGQSSAVSQQTTEVLLESANFDMYDIWRTTMNYGLFSPAATRFSRGQSQHQVDPVSRRGAELLALVGEGSIVGDYDCWPAPAELPPPIKVSPDFINGRLGTELSPERIQEILAGVELPSRLIQTGQLVVEIPFWRTDLSIAEDLVEEVGRLAGYEAIIPVLPVRSIGAPTTNRQLRFNRDLRQILAGAGANEVIGYSFVGSGLLQASGQSEDESFTVQNPLRPKLQFYRQSLTPTLVDLIRPNQRSGQAPLGLFEIGYCHWRGGPVDDDGLPIDQPRLGLVYLGPKTSPDQPFYAARRYLDLLAKKLGVEFDYRPGAKTDLVASWLAPYPAEARATVRLGQQVIGVVGQLDPQLAGFEIDPNDLRLQAETLAQSYQPLGRYPASYQDLTLKLPAKTLYADLLASLESVLAQTEFRHQLSLLSIWSPPDQTAVKHVSWRLELAAADRTLSTETVSELVGQLAAAARQDHKAALVT